MTGPILGIDLGTTNSLVGLVDTGFPVLVPDADGNRILPSVVRFSGGTVCAVGEPAKRARLTHPAEVIGSAKRLMGCRAADGPADAGGWGYRVEPGPDGRWGIALPSGWIPPEAVAVEILRELKGRAEHYLGHEIKRAVITVPAYFHDAQRQATKRAGEMAGLEVERILNEPTAAALAYGLSGQNDGRYAVFDLGGGTFDLSILEQKDGVFRVLATCGDTRLGGDDLDQAVAEELERRLLADLGPEALAVARPIFRDRAETLKIELGDHESVRADFPFLWQGQSWSCTLERSWLEEQAARVFAKIRHLIRRALSDAGVTPAELDDVLLVGGQTRMPWIRRLAADLFGKEPNTSVNPDEVIALGATIQAGMLEGSLHGAVLLDVTPLSLGIETFGGLMNVIIPRNSTIPCKAGEQFTSAVDGQSGVRIKILQGEREMAKDNWELGQFDLPFPPAPRGVPRVGVQFSIDANGILSVLGRDLNTGVEQTLTINTAVDVDSERVEAMVSQSVEHAFEDMAERRWVEAKLGAERAVAMTRKAIALLGTDVTTAEHTLVDQLLHHVDIALQSGDPRQLKEAIRALDEGTKPLAEKLMARIQ
ncbi:MAG: molecular chaperone DnaK [Candidatus Methylacidiphilales bacterium]